MVLDAAIAFVSTHFGRQGGGTFTEEPGHEAKVAPLHRCGGPVRVTVPPNQGNVGSSQ